MTDTATLELTEALIAKRSITPEDDGCQALIMARLEAIGFRCERLRFNDVENFWAWREGAKRSCDSARRDGARREGIKDGPLMVFAGHTDVVPPGPLDAWQSDPFVPTRRDGYLYGRGAADMKASLAAMVTACERFVAEHPTHRGSIGFLITSDEEGPACDGTVKVVEALTERGERIDYCLVGEPSSSKVLGDVIKNGRRGSLNGRLTVKGKQGHVAYPAQVRNPIHMAGQIVAALADQMWDRGNDFFPPTSFQVSNLRAGTGADNVVPGEAEVVFNFRFSTESTADSLRQRVHTIIETCLANEEIKSSQVFGYSIDWRLSGQPFLTEPGALVAAATGAIQTELGVKPELSTSGGTSDGRFIAPTGAQVLELGPVNATIHQLNECVLIDDIERLSRVYQATLSRLLN